MSEAATMPPTSVTGQNEVFHEPSTATSVTNDPTQIKEKPEENG